jgi:EAL domain-containing protein (putative c-di-GMP-specific phosphodiesterase class I)
MKQADTAMYHSKDSGKGCFSYFHEDMNEKVSKRLAYETDLRRALKNNEFELYYQPQIDLKTEKIIGMESLIRWNHPKKGFVSPLDFIPLAEETGLIVPIGEWVYRTACQQNKKWQEEGLLPIPVAINLSAKQFHDEQLVSKIVEVMNETGLDPKYVDMEVTESLAMENPEESIRQLKKLNGLGIKSSIDDFGTGYSSLSYLKSLPVSKLKIDKSFVDDITTDENDMAIAASVINLSHTMGMKVIAEGVETREQFEKLKELGCDYIQGYLFSKPLSAEDFRSYLEAEKK